MNVFIFYFQWKHDLMFPVSEKMGLVVESVCKCNLFQRSEKVQTYCYNYGLSALQDKPNKLIEITYQYCLINMNNSWKE